MTEKRSNIQTGKHSSIWKKNEGWYRRAASASTTSGGGLPRVHAPGKRTWSSRPRNHRFGSTGGLTPPYISYYLHRESCFLLLLFSENLRRLRFKTHDRDSASCVYMSPEEQHDNARFSIFFISWWSSQRRKIYIDFKINNLSFDALIKWSC